MRMKWTSTFLALLSSMGSLLIQSGATLEAMSMFWEANVIVVGIGLMTLFAVLAAHRAQAKHGQAAFHLVVGYASLAWFVAALIISSQHHFFRFPVFPFK